MIAVYIIFNSQAPDVPKLARQGIFKLSRLRVNCYVKTLKIISFILTLRILLSGLPYENTISIQDDCETHNNFMNFFTKNYTLYGKSN